MIRKKDKVQVKKKERKPVVKKKKVKTTANKKEAKLAAKKEKALMKKEKSAKKKEAKWMKKNAKPEKKKEKTGKRKVPALKREKQQTIKKKKAKISMRMEIFAITLVPLVILSAVITGYLAWSLGSGLENEALTGLKDLCYSIEEMYNQLDSGEYSLDGNYMKKGEYQITKDQTILDDFKKMSNIELTVYYGDTVKATSLTSHKTGKKILETQADAEVVETVINQKEEYSTSKAMINEREYYAYYIPLKNPGGIVVGMLCASKPCEEIDKSIQEKTMGVVLVALVFLVLAAVLVMLVSNQIGKAVQKAKGMLDDLSQGDLTISIDNRLTKRKDELGLMALALKGLMNELRDVMGNIKQSANVLSDAGKNLNDFAGNTRETADEISRAVSDISRGAVSQSEEIENATLHINDMGTTIEQIVSKIENLHTTSESMEQSKADAEDIIAELTESSERTYDAVKRIEQQVNLTDESVSKIKTAVSLISSIAEETNLLSLNASIEAARAGEAGKGFAVVAKEIQKLADESNRSAATIGDVINHLATESKNTVEAMNSMHSIIDEQKQKLQETKNKFGEVSTGIQSSLEEIEVIRTDSENCDEARIKVTDVIQNLSAVSEENAAATEETMASMDELNTTMTVLAEKSDELGALAEKMEADLGFFKL